MKLDEYLTGSENDKIICRDQIDVIILTDIIYYLSLQKKYFQHRTHWPIRFKKDNVSEKIQSRLVNFIDSLINECENAKNNKNA